MLANLEKIRKNYNFRKAMHCLHQRLKLNVFFKKNLGNGVHSMIRGILTQSCSTGAKNFSKCVFYHVQVSGVIQNIADHRAIKTKF